MPVVTELTNGDEVEIIRSKAATPPPAWESVAVTGKARSAIRRAARHAIRKQYCGLGQQILERTFHRAGKTFTRDGLKPYLAKVGFRELERRARRVGRGELSSADVFRAVHPDFQDSRAAKACCTPRRTAGSISARRSASCSACRRGGGREPRSASDPRRRRRPAGALRAGRRGAGRPDRRHLRAGQGDHDLPDPVSGADGLRRFAEPAGSTCAGTSIPRRPRVSGQDPRRRAERAGDAGRDRRDDRAQRRQYPQPFDDADAPDSRPWCWIWRSGTCST